jgi:hypothetical protein
VNSGQIPAKFSDEAESRPGVARKLRPCLGPTLAPDASEPKLRHLGLDFGNIHDLIAEVFSLVRVRARSQGLVTVLAHRRKNLLNHIHLVNGNEVSVLPFVPRLPSTLALLRFLRRPRFGLGSRSIG